MNNRDVSPGFDGRWDRGSLTGRVLPLESGVLPEDFLNRLRRLKEASGLTWNGFADAIGVDPKQVRRWLKEGVEPSGGPMLALFRFASRMPGGLDILMGEGFQMNLRDEESQNDQEDQEDEEDQEEEDDQDDQGAEEVEEN